MPMLMPVHDENACAFSYYKKERYGGTFLHVYAQWAEASKFKT